MPEMIVYDSISIGMCKVEAAYLLRLGVDVDAESWILTLESVDCTGEIGGLLSFWSNGEGDDGLGNIHRSLRQPSAAFCSLS
jgi:hypothetical protein